MGGEREREGEIEGEWSLPLAAAHGRYTAITRQCIDPAVRSLTVRRIPRWSNPLFLSFSPLLRSKTSFHLRKRKRGKRNGYGEERSRRRECARKFPRANIHKITSELFSVRANAKEAVFKVFRRKKYLISVYEPRVTACNNGIFFILRFMNSFFDEKDLQLVNTYIYIFKY